MSSETATPASLYALLADIGRTASQALAAAVAEGAGRLPAELPVPGRGQGPRRAGARAGRLQDPADLPALASVEFLREGSGTHLRVTEQGVFFVGKDDAASREQGTVWLLDKMAATLSNPHASA